MQQFGQVVAHGGHDVRVLVTNRSIEDTYHGNVDGRSDACPNVTESRVHASSSSLVDIEKEQIRAANPTHVDDSELGVDGDMAGEDSVELALEEQYDADSPLDCEQNCHTASSDFTCDKSSKDMATLFTNRCVTRFKTIVIHEVNPYP